MDFKKQPLSQSLISRFLFKGEERTRICPRNLYEVHILHSHAYRSESMMKGAFFESLCLGKAAKGKYVDDLPRKPLTKKQKLENVKRELAGQPLLKGEKSIDQQRIEEQARVFKIKANKYQMVLNEFNVQIKCTIPWHINPNVYLSMEYDIFPTTMYLRIDNTDQYQLVPAIVDLKLTTDTESQWGEYAWGAIEHMDLIQADMYNYGLRRLPYHLEMNPHLADLLSRPAINLIKQNKVSFYYWIFSYKKPVDKLILVKWDQTKEAELHETIRKAISVIDYWEALNWPTKPDYKVCKECTITDCKDRHLIQSV